MIYTLVSHTSVPVRIVELVVLEHVFGHMEEPGRGTASTY